MAVGELFKYTLVFLLSLCVYQTLFVLSYHAFCFRTQSQRVQGSEEPCSSKCHDKYVFLFGLYIQVRVFFIPLFSSDSFFLFKNNDLVFICPVLGFSEVSFQFNCFCGRFYCEKISVGVFFWYLTNSRLFCKLS